MVFHFFLEMTTKVLKFFALALLFAVILNTVNVDAAYKKPPFNGSIFGKRSGNIQGKIILFFNI